MKTTPTALTPRPSLAVIGSSQFARQASEQLQLHSQHDDCVLIVGPEGTGKESFARSIHAASSRQSNPFVPLNCKLFAANRLFDSQIFGHLPGAFAGLNTSSLGLIQAANGGMLFLDQVECLELESQEKLFRTIQDQKVVPLGGSEAIPVNVRVIASTCIDLPLAVSVGMFRNDFFQMLSAHVVEVNSLCDRSEDLPALAEEIAREVAAQREQPTKRFTDSAWQWIQRYEWPGNLRELRKMIDIVVTRDAEEVDARALRQAMKKMHSLSATFQRRMLPARFTGFAAMRATRGPSCREKT